MDPVTPSWRAELESRLKPFAAALGDRRRGRMCPRYVGGLIGVGDRKSIQAREGGVGYDQLHHFVAAGTWNRAPVEAALLKEADRLVGGEDAFLIIDDTALPKKGRHSVGVSPQYATSLGKNANCQTLVSTTLAQAFGSFRARQSFQWLSRFYPKLDRLLVWVLVWGTARHSVPSASPTPAASGAGRHERAARGPALATRLSQQRIRSKGRGHRSNPVGCAKCPVSRRSSRITASATPPWQPGRPVARQSFESSGAAASSLIRQRRAPLNGRERRSRAPLDRSSEVRDATSNCLTFPRWPGIYRMAE